MALQVEGLLFDMLTADPGAPVEGQFWYNTTDKLYKAFRNGATTSFVDAAAMLAHTGSNANPHNVTLEQARAENGTVAGPINMAGYPIQNMGYGTAANDAANRQFVLDQITQRLQGLDWQESVLSRLATPPASPVSGARYLIIATATGAWAGKENQIAQYSGSAWVFTTATKGSSTRVEGENLIYTFDGTAWGNIGGAIQHAALLGLLNDDHTQYLRADGNRAMSGPLNMGGQAITNVGNVDGVDLSAHAARHQPGGADALPTAAAVGIDNTTANGIGSSTSFSKADHTHALDHTNGNISAITAGATANEGTGTGVARRDHQHSVATAAPVSITDANNVDGTAATLARSDHQHAHGARGGGNLHAVVGTPATGAGFHPQSNFVATSNPTVSNDGSQGYSAGSRWVNTANSTEWCCVAATIGAAIWVMTSNLAAGFLQQKAGRVAGSSFAGSPKKVTVTFAAAFADTGYAIALTAVSQNGATYAPVVESQLAGSFVINLGTHTASNLLFMNWTATKVGESY